MNWYQGEDQTKNVSEVIIDVVDPKPIGSKFGMIMLGTKFHLLRSNVWTTGYFRMDSDPGPYLMIRADGFIDKLKNQPFRVAHCFYKMQAGGLFAIFIDFPQIEGSGMPSNPFPFVLFEMIRGIDMEDQRERIYDAINRSTLHICFVEGDGPGEQHDEFWSGGVINARYDVVINLSQECRNTLNKEWESLLDFHDSLPPTNKDFHGSFHQMQSANPITRNPIIDKGENAVGITTEEESKIDTSEPISDTLGQVQTTAPIPQNLTGKKTQHTVVKAEEKIGPNLHSDVTAENFRKKQNQSFWKGVILSAVVIFLLGTLAYFVYGTMINENSDIKISETDSILLEEDLNENTETLEKTIGVNENTIVEENLPNTPQKQYFEIKEPIAKFSNKRELSSGDTLYVWANSGLLIRDNPSTNANKIGHVTFGDYIIASSKTDPIKHTDPLKISSNQVIPIKGNWMKMEKGITGYMFDGYLSRLPTYSANYSVIDYIQKANTRFNKIADFQILNETPLQIKIEGLNFNELFLMVRHLYNLETNFSLSYGSIENQRVFISDEFRIEIRGTGLSYMLFVKRN